MKDVFEPLSNPVENITKSITEISIKNIKEISDLNEKVLDLMDEKGLIAPYLASSLVNLFKPENNSQFRLRKDLISTKMNDFLIHGNIPVSLHSNIITFRDSNEAFRLDGGPLKLITNYKFNADHSSPQDKKLIFEFAKEMNYDTKSIGRPSIRQDSIIKRPNSPAIMASGISKTKILCSDPNELWDRLRISSQERHGGNISNSIDKEIVALVDKLLDYKCISEKQHK